MHASLNSLLLYCVIPFDAVGGSEDMRRSNECSATDIDIVILVFFQDGHLPGIFSEFGLSVHVWLSLDSAVDAVRIAASACSRRGGRVTARTADGSSATDLIV